MRMPLKELINAYIPVCAQEEADRALMLSYMDRFDDVLSRENPLCHFTASAWLTNKARDKICMAYHNIYNSWAWVGGHADGEADLLAVALKEAREETGIAEIVPVRNAPVSLEILPVQAHYKRGKFVSPHVHLNLTFLLCADDKAPVRAKEDENSAVGWFAPEEAVEKSSEADMKIIYKKLNDALRKAAK